MKLNAAGLAAAAPSHKRCQLAPLFFCGHHQHNNSLCLIPVAMAASKSKHLLLLLLLKVIPLSVNTDLLSQDWSCEFRGGRRRPETLQNLLHKRVTSFYDI